MFSSGAKINPSLFVDWPIGSPRPGAHWQWRWLGKAGMLSAPSAGSRLTGEPAGRKSSLFSRRMALRGLLRKAVMWENAAV
jgi:hypothetical protein